MAHVYCNTQDSDPHPQGTTCPHAEDGCSCPLCPEEQALQPQPQIIWYPGEPICTKREYQRIRWIRNQKRIARVGAPADRYFTVGMLEAVVQVRKGIAGISPDQPISNAHEAEETWIADHKGPSSRT